MKQNLADEVTRIVWRKRRASVPDIANELKHPVAASEIMPIIEQMVERGTLEWVESTLEIGEEHRHVQVVR